MYVRYHAYTDKSPFHVLKLVVTWRRGHHPVTAAIGGFL